MAFYPVSSTVGADLNNASSSSSFALGTRTRGSSDSLWVYVQALGAITTGNCVAITAAGTAKPAIMTDTTAATNELGFAQTSAADAQYLWVARNGLGMYVSCSGGVTANTALYVSSAQSGLIVNTAATGSIVGVQLSTATGTAYPNVGTANLSWPKGSSAGF